MAKFMLLLHDNPTAFADVSPEQMQKVIEKYQAWGKRLRDQGVIQGGHKLTDEPGKVMRSKDGQVRITDGPFANIEGILVRSNPKTGMLVVSVHLLRRSVAVHLDCTQLEAA